MDRCPRIVGRGPNLPTPSGVSLPTCSTPRPWWPPRADFEAVFRDAFEPMVRALTVASGSRTVAEDCVQEAFSRAFVRWRRIGGYDDPAGWIRHVAVNVMRDHHRREQRKRRAVTRLAARPDEVTAAPEPGAGLAELVAALPEQQRIAASLFYVEQLSVRETAARDGPVRGGRQVPPPRSEDLAAACLGAEPVTDHDPLDELDDPDAGGRARPRSRPERGRRPVPGRAPPLRAAPSAAPRRDRERRASSARGRGRARGRRAPVAVVDGQRRPHREPAPARARRRRGTAPTSSTHRPPSPSTSRDHDRRRHRRPRDVGTHDVHDHRRRHPDHAGAAPRRDRRQRRRLGPGPDRRHDGDAALEHTGRGIHGRRAGVGPAEVEVRFRMGSSGGTEHRIRLRFDSDGTLQREVT